MLKRSCSSENQTNKRHVELLPHSIVEFILERLPVQSLLRFKCVSKKWKSTIESRQFQERQLICRRQSRGPDLLCVSLCHDLFYREDALPSGEIVLWTSVRSTVRLCTPYSMICRQSTCDGLLCIYTVYTPNVVVNPATRWQRSFPLSNIQQFIVNNLNEQRNDFPSPCLGFGKDKVKGIYKPVWLYNSSNYGFDNVTTCEVFDFSTNTWRYIHPASPYRVNDYRHPVYLDGSLHWLTVGEESKVLSFDLHTETFQVICKTPFSDQRDSIMCILDDSLCVTKINGSIQVIWLLDSSNSNKTWKKLCSIDVTEYPSLSSFLPFSLPFAPIRILDQNKLLLQDLDTLGYPVIYDIEAQFYELQSNTRGYHVYYFPNLFSVLSN